MDRLRQELGLNDPPWVQYGRFLVQALQGDLGTSLQTRRPVLGEILTFLPATLQLTARRDGCSRSSSASRWARSPRSAPTPGSTR